MPSVCVYFQVHQPYRLRRYSIFDANEHYFDGERNRHILKRVAEKCYLPATRLILELIRRHEGRFRVAFSFTGIILEQWRQHCPAAIELFVELVETGCVELLAEPYHHSLAALYSPDEFRQQVDAHTALIEQLFGVTPAVFRNTELIYSNEIADLVAAMGRFRGILAEGVDHILAGRSPNKLYRPPELANLKLLLKNHVLSDDIAFRFSNRAWQHWPLTAGKFTEWITAIDRVAEPSGREAGSGDGPGGAGGGPPAAGDDEHAQRRRALLPGPVCNLFMDYETFGEHQWAETGIFAFLEDLPHRIIRAEGCDFKTPSELVAAVAANDELDVRQTTSWADTERDLSAWVGNAMQASALHELYRLEARVKQAGDARLLEDWRRLTCSDHFYYMCTKYFDDGAVHKYFNPYESPYDSYINFMNVLDNLRTRIESTAPAKG